MAAPESKECDWLFPAVETGFGFFCLVMTGNNFLEDFCCLESFGIVAIRKRSSFFGSGFLFAKMSGFLTIFRGEEGKNFLGSFGLASGMVTSL